MDHRELLRRIGSRIRARRRELGLTQAQLGTGLCTKSMVSQIERGGTAPSLETLVALADRLGRPVEWFVAEEPRHMSPLEEIARKVGMETEQMRAVLEAVLRSA